MWHRAKKILFCEGMLENFGKNFNSLGRYDIAKHDITYRMALVRYIVIISNRLFPFPPLSSPSYLGQFGRKNGGKYTCRFRRFSNVICGFRSIEIGVEVWVPSVVYIYSTNSNFAVTYLRMELRFNGTKAIFLVLRPPCTTLRMLHLII